MDVRGRLGVSPSQFRKGQRSPRSEPGVVTAGISVEGVDEINGQLVKFERQAMPTELRKATREAAGGKKSSCRPPREKVRKRTGDLAKAITVRAIKPNRKGKIGHQVTVPGGHLFKGDKYYAGFQGLGTVDMEAHPYLRPASTRTKTRSAACSAPHCSERSSRSARAPARSAR